jgi:thiamine biosynthesis lipoprotein
VSARYEFGAMGCTVVVGGGGRWERVAIERLFAEREKMFSRFRPESELNRVNASAGTWTHVSEVFAAVLRLALGARQETRGLVDPTFGAELDAAGYDRDFSRVEDGTAAPREVPRPAGSVRVDGRSVLVPVGMRLDLNGVVKGRTVDDALALMRFPGFVSAGGDLATRSGVVVALPRGGTVRLVRGGLATSGSDRRRWVRAGRTQHHLIDPRTGRSAVSAWEQVTVCGASCVGADVAAKAAFLLGPAGPAWLDAAGLPGRFVAHDGTVSSNRSWQRSVDATCT